MWLLSSTVFIVMSLNPVLFFDDFEKQNLPGWRIYKNTGVQVKQGNLVLEGIAKNVLGADMDIDVPGAKDWSDYTVIIGFRITKMTEQSQFIVNVRFHIGRFKIFTSQSINIFPHEQKMEVYTIRAEEAPDDPPINRGNIVQALELGKWYILAIETLNNNYEIFLDNRQLLSYSDPGTLPGTVNLSTGPFGTIKVELDYIRVTQEAYSINVNPQKKLAVTWSAIKNPKGQR